MTLDWGAFFQAAGQGLTDYALYKDQEAEKRRAEQRQDSLDQERRAHEERLAAMDERRIRLDERQALEQPAQHRADALGKFGIVVPNDFVQNQMQAQLPETPQESAYTTPAAKMAVDALRTAGQQGVNRVYQEAPGAMDRLMKGQGLTETMPSGGFAAMEPNVRASLQYAASNERIAEQNRRNAMTLATMRAKATGAGRQNLLETKRMEFITKRAGGLMKPQLGGVLGTDVIVPALPAGNAYTQARDEWELALGHTPASVGATRVPDSTGGSAALARPGFGAFGESAQPSKPADRWEELVGRGVHPDSATAQVRAEFGLSDQNSGQHFDADAVSAEVARMDPKSARQLLEASGYSEEEINEVLGSHVR